MLVPLYLHAIAHALTRLGIVIRLRVTVVLLGAALLAVPAAAWGGSFQIAWNGDGTITQHGFAAKVDAGAACGFPGNATSALAGSFPGSGGCFFLFNAPGAATIQSTSVSGHYNKATSNADLCARSFAGIGSPAPLVACSAGDFSQTIPIANGTWVELGLYNQSSTAIPLSTDNANNVLFTSGSVVMNDPTPPQLSLSAAVPNFVGGDSLAVHFAATDAESRAGLVSWSLDGSGGASLIADGCTDVFVCGGSSSGDFTVAGLANLPDGGHAITVDAHSAGGDTVQDVPFVTDHTPPQIASGLTVDYATRTVSLLVEDTTSGVGSAELYADGTPLPSSLSTPTGTAADTRLVTATIPAVDRLDGAVIDVTASDAATPANVLDTRGQLGKQLVVPVRVAAALPASGNSPAAIAARARRAATSLTVSLRRFGSHAERANAGTFQVDAGQVLVAHGILAGASGKCRITLRLGTGTHKQRWIVITRADGSFRHGMRPRVGGTLIASYAGDANLAPARRAGVRVIITPRISAHFTATRVPGGFRNPVVSGRFAPVGGFPVVLAWQARSPHGHWQLVGGVSTTIRPDHRGHLTGKLPITLAADVQLRLVYLSTPGASLAAAVSKTMIPRLHTPLFATAG
jgi:hypothetical protein